MLEHQTYTKINTLYKRDDKGHIIIGDFSRPEFKYLYNNEWLWYLKIDGTNTGIHFDGDLKIDGKSEKAQWNPKVIDVLKSIVDINKFKTVFPADENGVYPNVIVYGETYGSTIQDKAGKLYFDGFGVGFRVFDIKVNGYWLEPDDIADVASKLGFEMPTCFGKMTIAEAEDMVKAGFKDTIAEHDLDAEGLVGRPLTQFFNKKGERVMVKVKTCDYRKIGITDK